MDLKFKKPEEVVTSLCERLRKERLYLEMTQADVATRAGVSVNTVSNLEAGRNVSFEKKRGFLYLAFELLERTITFKFFCNTLLILKFSLKAFHQL